MIDRKKLVQRLNKGSRLKEFPLLNLYILVAAFFHFLGRLIHSQLLSLLRPVPLLLMLVYLHSKNNTRKHLVPSLVEVALLLFLFEAIASLYDPLPNPLCSALRAIAHLVYSLALSLGEAIRYGNDVRVMRWVGYVIILGASGTAFYYLRQKLPHGVISIAELTIVAAQMWISLWRYEITLRSSFIFSAAGSALLLMCGWMGLWAQGLGTAFILLMRECGHYFLMHGSLHQSNLQFQIDKLHDNYRRNY